MMLLNPLQKFTFKASLSSIALICQASCQPRGLMLDLFITVYVNQL